MSFVDLMKNDVWSEADIKARLHAEIRSQISAYTETELNRALQGLAMGLHQLTSEEQATLALFKATTDRVAVMGVAARADMVLLHETLAVEAAQRRLDQPVLEPVKAQDGSERAAAQAVVTAASTAALDLVALRNPAPAVPAPVEAP